MSLEKLAYPIPEAAEAAGVSEKVLRQAINKGDLQRRYPSSRPVILTTDLQEWLESLPNSPRP